MSLAKSWTIYRNAVYPPKIGLISATQELETKQAYYAGAFTALSALLEVASKSSEEDASRFVANIIQEAETECRKRTQEMKAWN